MSPARLVHGATVLLLLLQAGKLAAAQLMRGA
jgi:hypothetical protein